MKRGRIEHLWFVILVALVAWLTWRSLSEPVPVAAAAAAAPVVEGFQLFDLINTISSGVELSSTLSDIFPSLNCDSEMVGPEKRWLCPSDSKAASVAVQNPMDTTCYPDKISPFTYYCNMPFSSPSEQAVANGYGTAPVDIAQRDLTRACSSLRKVIHDISGNTNSAVATNTFLDFAMQSITADLGYIDSIRTKMACGTDTVSIAGLTGTALQTAKVCNTANAARRTIADNQARLQTLRGQLNGTGGPILTMQNIRYSLRMLYKKFNCK